MLVKRHKKVFITLLIIAALLLSYPLWPSLVRCQVARLKLVAVLQYQEIIHSDDDKDYVEKNSNGAEKCYFENKQTLHALKKMVLTSQVADLTHASLSPWPTPFYYVGKMQVGGYGNFIYHERFAFYLLNPSIDDRTKLLDYVNQIVQNGEMDGMK